MNIATLPPKPDASRRYRISSDSVWPLRRADGTTLAEAPNKEQENNQ